MGRYNLIAAWGLIVAAMVCLPITPVLIMALCLGTMMYSIGYIDSVLSCYPLVVWDDDRAIRAGRDPAYCQKLLRRINSALKKMSPGDGGLVVPYSWPSLRNRKQTISLCLLVASLSFLLLINFIHDEHSWVKYFPIIIFFTVVLLVSMIVILALYYSNRQRFIASKTIGCLEAKVNLLAKSGPDYREMGKTLKTLSDICPPVFWFDKVLYDLDRSH